MGFWGSLFGGSNSTLSGGMTKAGQVADYGISKGEGLTSQAGDFFSTLLGGDPAKTAKLLAPQIQTMQKQGQQAKNTMAQFGNRSGGTNAKAQTIDDTTRANIDNMISTLTGQAASGAASIGQNLIDTGLKSLNQQVDFSQMQMENWANSLLGQGLTSAAAFGEKAGMNWLSGKMGGGTNS